MVIPTYQVDGIPCETEEQAEVIAQRIFKRYGGYRSVTIMEVDHHGDKNPLRTIEATKDDDPDADTETLQLF